jgi:uncharacterized protein YajQ (UPF0234 family)
LELMKNTVSARATRASERVAARLNAAERSRGALPGIPPARIMPRMPSFDVVSELDKHEVRNAVDQANREVQTRFDFKNTGARYALGDFLVTLEAPSEFQLGQMREILTGKLARRGVDVAAMAPQEPETALSKARQNIVLRHGVDTEHARRIVKLLKESKLKVQAAIQGEQIRVSGKKRDDLQEAIRIVKGAKLDLPLQFTNFRD